jgi:uncharacterized protein YbjT (DUF2867 family)
MVTTLLTGATGMLGGALQPRLAESGHTVRGTTRTPPGEGPADEWVQLSLPGDSGVKSAVDGVDVVVHAASDARGDHEAVDVRGTEQLLEAAEAANVANFVYVSIVGIDDVPYSYYESKVAAEELVEASDVPGTIVRLTQFHPFIDMIAGLVAKLPAWPLPTTWQLQPIDVGEAADAVVEHATTEPAGRVPEVGGPEVRTLGELAVAYRQARGLRRPILRLPVPGAMSRRLRDGEITCPQRDNGTITWDAYLEETYE